MHQGFADVGAIRGNGGVERIVVADADRPVHDRTVELDRATSANSISVCMNTMATSVNFGGT